MSGVSLHLVPSAAALALLGQCISLGTRLSREISCHMAKGGKQAVHAQTPSAWRGLVPKPQLVHSACTQKQAQRRAEVPRVCLPADAHV